MLASVLDYPREELDQEIWNVENGLELQPDIHDQIVDIVQSFLDDMDLPEEALLDVLIYGSILTNQYNAKTDVDARILLEPNVVNEYYPGITGDDLFDLAQDTVHGVLLGDTKHPLNATVVIEGEETELGQSELGLTEHEPVYSMVKEELLQEGTWYDESFDPDVEFSEERKSIDEVMELLDNLIRETKTDTIDYELIEEAVSEVKNKDELMRKLDEKLLEINEGIAALVEEYDKIKKERKDSYKDYPGKDKHKSPGNIRFKFLEKYKYMDMIKKLKRIFEGGVEESEMDDVSEALQISSDIDPKLVPSPRQSVPAPPEPNPLAIEDGAMMHGASCPRCGWVNPMTAAGGGEITCANCGKKFTADQPFTINTGPSSSEDLLPYPSDFTNTGALNPQDVEDIDKTMEELGVSPEVRDKFKKKVTQPQDQNVTPPAPATPHAPESPSTSNKPKGLEPMKKITKDRADRKNRSGFFAEPTQRDPGGSPYPPSQSFSEAKKEDKKKNKKEDKEDELAFEVLTVLEGIDLLPFLEDESLLEELLAAFPILGEENKYIDLYAQLQFWDKINFYDLGIPRARIVSLLGTVPLRGNYRVTEDVLFVEHPQDAAAIENLLRFNAQRIEALPVGPGQYSAPSGAPDYEERPRRRRIRDPEKRRPLQDGSGQNKGQPGGMRRMKKKNPACPFKDDNKEQEKEGEAVGINWMDSYPTKYHAVFSLLAQYWSDPTTTYTQAPTMTQPTSPTVPAQPKESPTWEEPGEEVPLRKTKQEPEWAWSDEPEEETVEDIVQDPIYPNQETAAAAAYLVHEPKFREKMLKKVKSLFRKTWNEAHVRAYLNSIFTELMYKNVYKLNEPYQQLALAALEKVDWDSIVDAYTSGMTGPEYMSEEEEIEDVYQQLQSISSAKEDFDLSADEAKELGEKLGIDWDEVGYTPEDFIKGIKVEFEHGSVDPETDVTGDDLEETAKIAWAHLKEMDDYYDKLEKMESDANTVVYGEKAMKEKTAQAFMVKCPNCGTIQKSDFWEETKCPNCSAPIPAYEEMQRFRPSDEKIQPPPKKKTPLTVVTHESVRSATVQHIEGGALSNRIDRATRSKINAELENAGLDGNGRFKSPGEALNVISDILKKYNIVLASYYHDFSKPSGQVTIELARSENPEVTQYVENPESTDLLLQMLVFSWYLYEEIDQFECLAYIS